ncbi:DUF397 domain-containing protein [Streptomyces sp. NPDC006863]|uniref:DUF397 domain-containing protein n=1 Tax=Streptomyces sp. NPDC006863 TaxID=3154779 RepID=UPI0033CA4819
MSRLLWKSSRTAEPIVLRAHSGTNNNCIEHAVLVSGRHAVRDTKDRALGAHTFGPEQWRAFVAAVQDGSPQGS